MAARAIGSGTIAFGLVSIPVKVYTSSSSKTVSFNMLHQETGERVKMQYYLPSSGQVIERSETVKGFEYSRGQYVQFTEEELKALEAERTNTMEIVEFVPLDTVDLIQVEKSYYLGPDKGGDKAYRMLAQAMDRKQVVAVGRWASRGKQHLVLIRPYHDGLLLHQMYYATEMRAFNDVNLGAEFTFSAAEEGLADQLIDQLRRDSFDPEQYRDEYAEKVLAIVDQKVAGQEITVAPEAPKAQIIDLFEALKQSLDVVGKPAAEAPALAKATPAKAKATAKAEAASKAKGVKKAADKSPAKRSKKASSG